MPIAAEPVAVAHAPHQTTWAPSAIHHTRRPARPGHAILNLQRTLGNVATQRVLSRQAKTPPQPTLPPSGPTGRGCAPLAECPADAIVIAAEHPIYAIAEQCLQERYRQEGHQANTLGFNKSWRSLNGKDPAERAALRCLYTDFVGKSGMWPGEPDIWDFSNRTMYEITTPSGVAFRIPKLAAELVNATKIASPMECGGTSYFAGNWVPRSTCYLLGEWGDTCALYMEILGNESGVLVYQPLLKCSNKDEQEAKAGALAEKRRDKARKRRAATKQRLAALRLTELQPELERMIPTLQKELRLKYSSVPEGSEYAILITPSLYRQRIAEPRAQRLDRLLEFHGLDPGRNPAIGYLNLGLTAMLAATGGTICEFYVGSNDLSGAAVCFEAMAIGSAAGALGMAGVAGVGAGAGTATLVGGGAEVIDLAAFRVVHDIAKAAGVVLVVGLASESKAAGAPGQPGGERRDILRAEAVRVAPTTSLRGAAEPEVVRRGDEVTYAGAPYVVVGRAVARPAAEEGR